MTEFLEPLPSTWVFTKISDIAEVNPKLDKTRIPDNLEVSFVPMPAVEELTGRIDLTASRRFSEVKKGYTAFQEDDVLFAKITPCMENGKMAIVPALKNGHGFGSTEFHVLRPAAGVDARYIYYFVSSERFRAHAEHNMTGAVGQRRVATSYLSEQRMPLAPPEEQCRIVTRLEDLFSELDKGVDALTTARKQIAAYRNAVLKAAFAGRLTGSDSTSWAEYRVGEVVSEVRYGTAKKCSVDPNKTPVLRIPNIASGRIDLDNLKHAEFTADELAKLRLEPGDILVVRSNGSVSLVGLSAVVTASAAGYAYAGYLIRLRVKKEVILPEFLKLYLHSPAVRINVERQARSTSGVHNINSDELRAIPIRVPPIAAQHLIIDTVSEILSRIDDVEFCTEAELKRCVALRQAILARAFSGQLVRQEAKDEPASALLERIRADREGAKTRKDRTTRNGRKAAA